MRLGALALAAVLLPLPCLAHDDAARMAGTDVPVPKRLKFARPVYPPEAQAQGQRGIVILELLIDEMGKVASADVIRSVPPFDEAALSAARQWEYEVTKVNGQPVRVRLTVPITFALPLPQVVREDGVPELRQGAVPGYPQGAQGPAQVTVDVTLLPDGSVAEAQIKTGMSPWAEALLGALRTWRFAPEGGDAVVGFEVQADFGPPPPGSAPARIDLRISNPRRAQPAAEAESTPGPEPSPSPAPAPAAPSAPAATSPAEPAPETAALPAPGAAAPATDTPPEAPPVEIVSGDTTPPPPPPTPGFSSVRDVSLGAGVPDLAKGRRPVVPPVARMARTGGEVEVQFDVDAAGSSSVREVNGPDLLKEAARQTVASWTFRRTSTDRIYLRAVLIYQGEQAHAAVATR